MTVTFPDIKLIRHAGTIKDQPDDPSFPFKLVADLRPPAFMDTLFVFLYGGSEEIVVRAMTKEALDRFIEVNELRNHPRIRSLTITGPDGVVIDCLKPQTNDSQSK